MKVEKNQLGRRIKESRLKSKLSQIEFAGKINVSRETIIAYEGGKRFPTVDLVEKISLVASVDFWWLLTGSPPAESAETPAPVAKPPVEDESRKEVVRLQSALLTERKELLKSKDETIRLQNELLSAHKSMNEKENTVSNLEARLQKLEESSKELEKLREENTSLKKEIAAQEVSEEGKSQLAS